MGDEFSLEDALIILKRRILYFLLPVMVLAPIGVLAVMLLPAKYTAQGTILVESQQIPSEFVRSTVNAYAQERIQTIRQRVMTRNTLLEVAADHNLFPRSLGLSESQRVSIMRRNLRVNLISSGRGDRRGDGTIAFTVSYTDQNPNKAFLVANEFMTLFLNEDVRTRTAGASSTTEFFAREAARLRDALSEVEDDISRYKSENSEALPEHLDIHLSMLERARNELNAAESAIVQLEEEKRFLETQLVSGAGSDNSMAEEMRRLESELTRLRATYRDNYPEVIAKREEIAAVRRQMQPAEEINRLRDALAEAERSLITLERNPAAEEGAVANAEAQVETARLALSDRISEETRKGATDITGIQLEGRLAVIGNRIRMLTKQADDSRLDIADLEQRIAKTPEVERGLSALTRDNANLFREYQEVLAKQQDAQLAESLEENQQAERFSILEPAMRPDSPSSPNRPQLIVLALIAAFGAGGAAALGMELLMSTIRGRNHISGLMEDHPIAVIPYIRGERENRFGLPFFSWRKRGPTPKTV